MREPGRELVVCEGVHGVNGTTFVSLLPYFIHTL